MVWRLYWVILTDTGSGEWIDGLVDDWIDGERRRRGHPTCKHGCFYGRIHLD